MILLVYTTFFTILLIQNENITYIQETTPFVVNYAEMNIEDVRLNDLSMLNNILSSNIKNKIVVLPEVRLNLDGVNLTLFLTSKINHQSANNFSIIVPNHLRSKIKEQQTISFNDASLNLNVIGYCGSDIPESFSSTDGYLYIYQNVIESKFNYIVAPLDLLSYFSNYTTRLWIKSTEFFQPQNIINSFDAVKDENQEYKILYKSKFKQLPLFNLLSLYKLNFPQDELLTITNDDIQSQLISNFIIFSSIILFFLLIAYNRLVVDNIHVIENTLIKIFQRGGKHLENSIYAISLLLHLLPLIILFFLSLISFILINTFFSSSYIALILLHVISQSNIVLGIFLLLLVLTFILTVNQYFFEKHIPINVNYSKYRFRYIILTIISSTIIYLLPNFISIPKSFIDFLFYIFIFIFAFCIFKIIQTHPNMLVKTNNFKTNIVNKIAYSNYQKIAIYNYVLILLLILSTFFVTYNNTYQDSIIQNTTGNSILGDIIIEGNSHHNPFTIDSLKFQNLPSFNNTQSILATSTGSGNIHIGGEFYYTNFMATDRNTFPEFLDNYEFESYQGQLKKQILNDFKIIDKPIIITGEVASKYGINIGDKIDFYLQIIDKTEIVHLTVIGITSIIKMEIRNNDNGYMYFPFDIISPFFDSINNTDYGINNLIINVDYGLNQNELSSIINEISMYFGFEISDDWILLSHNIDPNYAISKVNEWNVPDINIISQIIYNKFWNMFSIFGLGMILVVIIPLTNYYRISGNNIQEFYHKLYNRGANPKKIRNKHFSNTIQLFLINTMIYIQVMFTTYRLYISFSYSIYPNYYFGNSIMQLIYLVCISIIETFIFAYLSARRMYFKGGK